MFDKVLTYKNFLCHLMVRIGAIPTMLIYPRASLFLTLFSCRHVGWKSLQTAEYYMQTGKVMKMSHAASALADSTLSVEGDPSVAISVANLFRIKNELRGFSLAFP